jgi:DNA-binding transcriptional regulator of glucitol operon
VLTLCVCVQVSELETALEKEQQLGRVLQCSLQGRVVCHCCLSALVPTNVSTSHTLCMLTCTALHRSSNAKSSL